MPVARTASSGSPAPAADPIAAGTQIAAAGVRPRTESRRTKISPAPRNPPPVSAHHRLETEAGAPAGTRAADTVRAGLGDDPVPGVPGPAGGPRRRRDLWPHRGVPHHGCCGVARYWR